ncbi:MAG: iron export ABC transporter permease subunit FetB [Deltaproteobacteria bacterium]|nr:iron export ABC transporter permease subunit FetB [Deltaproteobacteria bacterium]
MNTAAIDIGPWQLALTLVFVLLAQVFSLIYRLGLNRDLTIGTIRTFAQLFLMGYALKVIFRLSLSWVTLSVFLIMIICAVYTIKGRVKEKAVPFALPMFVAMLISYFVVSVTVTGVIVGAKPWWQPQYFIPIAGMVIGNSMNALAVSIERLFSDLRTKMDMVEMHLAHGADFREASWEIVRGAVKAGMIPSINSMMGVGIVFIPGMMTGQTLSGADPVQAIRYQIMVMLMLVASAALGTVIVVLITRNRCFGKSQRLLLGRR